jgi:glycosylphosphatidylinositol phospholipase D
VLVAVGLLVAEIPAAPAAEAPIAGTLDLGRRSGPARGVDERLTGFRLREAGSKVAVVGDVNRDGHQDYAVAAPSTNNRSGEVDVVFGPPAGTLGLGSGLGARGIRIDGPHPGALAGFGVSGVGDVNGDGYDDILIGAPGMTFTDRGTSGAAFVVYGGARPESGRISLASLGTGGIVIAGASPGDVTGSSVAAVGDLDGDGRAELAIGAPYASGFGRARAGGAFVVYSGALSGTSLDLGALGIAGYRIDGAAAGDWLGYSLAGVRDMNGDQLPELVLGAPRAVNLAGSASIVWGRRAATTGVDLATLGGQGFTATGHPGEFAGSAVAGLDDATGDGVPDVAIGAPGSAPYGRASAGSLYVLAGRADPAPASLGDAWLRLRGGDRGGQLGSAVAPAGDVDDDGRADLLVGEPGAQALARARAGASWLFLTGRLGSGDVDAALPGFAGIRFAGYAGARSGRALAGGRDLNEDGREDVLIGLPGVHRRGGAAVVAVPALPRPPATFGPVADNVEVIIDDSSSMRRYDPRGLLRRQALELMLTNPANRNRVFGAVEFDATAHQVLPPMRVADSAVQGPRLDVLRALLAERIDNSGRVTNLASGFDAAARQNPGARARILFTDGGLVSGILRYTDVPTYVIGLRLRKSGFIQRLMERVAARSGGAFYAVNDAGGLQAALAAIDARLRGETPLLARLLQSPGVTPVRPSVRGEVAAAVTGAGRRVPLRATASSGRVQRLRLAVTWNRRGSRFRLRAFSLQVRGGRKVRVGRRQLRRALSGRPQRLRGGLRLKGRSGRTFLTLDVRGLPRRRGGRRASASVYGVVASSRLRRTRGSHRTVVRSRWTFQRRPG